MDPDRVRQTALALLAVATVVLTATAAVPVFTQSHGGDRPPGIQMTDRDATTTRNVTPSLPIRYVLAAIFALGALAIVVQFVVDPWETLQQVVGVALVVGLMVVVVRFLLTLNPPSPDTPASGPSSTVTPTPAGASGFGSGTSDPLALPVDAIAILAVVAVALGVLPLLLWRSDTVRSALGFGRRSEESESDVELETIGRVAGDAADRIEEASVPRAADNAVFRAWREMVALLDAPDPRSGTPRQFAEAAIEAGMDPDDVTELTRTFEEVRYGDAPLSEERREAAIRALRRIQATHGEEGDE